jgi:putative cell wall-binding protein
LQGVEIKRIDTGSLYEECWLFAEDVWRNGTAEVVLTSSLPADIFRAYEKARMAGAPIIVCEGDVTEKVNTVIAEMTKRNVTLSKALLVGEIGAEYAKPLQNAGIKTEEVKA